MVGFNLSGYTYTNKILKYKLKMISKDFKISKECENQFNLFSLPLMIVV